MASCCADQGAQEGALGVAVVLVTTGGGASAMPHLAVFSYLFGWLLFAIGGGLLFVRLAKSRLRRM